MSPCFRYRPPFPPPPPPHPSLILSSVLTSCQATEPPTSFPTSSTSPPTSGRQEAGGGGLEKVRGSCSAVYCDVWPSSASCQEVGTGGEEVEFIDLLFHLTEIPHSLRPTNQLIAQAPKNICWLLELCPLFYSKGFSTNPYISGSKQPFTRSTKSLRAKKCL